MGLFATDSQRNLCRKKRRRLLTTIGGSSIAAVALTRSLDGKVAQGLALEGMEGVNLEAFSPYAQMTVVEGEVGRDDMSFFQVQTEAWKSTRVRVSIDDCSPLTAVIASFGAEPVPSRHDFLAHATLDADGNGTCGVDVISRPSFIRDGFWHFAVVGGDPLLGNRYFAGPPDMLKFEAVVAAETAVYPTLDRGVAPWGYCVRRVSTPPVSVPIIRYRAGESGDGNFLPTIGRFPSVSDTVKVDSYKNENDEHTSQEAKRAASWPHWLGDFTVSAYDEVVTIHFELAALVDGKPVARKNHVTGGRRDGARSEGIEGGSDISKRRHGRGRELTSQAEQEENNESFHRYERHGNDGDGDVCEVILCAAAGVISLGFPHDPRADPKLGEWRSGDETSVCKSATVERNGTAVSGILELSQRPQAGRWYLTARADCGSSSPHGRHLGLEFSGEPSNRSTDGMTEGVDNASLTASSINSPFNNSSDTAPGVASEGRETKQGGLDKDSGWGGLKVLSMQRDWAHMEWKADALVPDGSENGADPETCPSVVDAKDAIELRAAVVTQACPMGAVGVGGVDMTPLDAGDGSSSSSSSGGTSGEASRRFACVGTLLPMTMSRSGADKVYEGRPRALSNLLLDEGGASKEQDGVDDEPSRWMWRGPQPPSVWYAVDMNGREIGASMAIKLTVNSSAPASDATRSALDSPSAWRMGPYSESGEGEFDVDGWGCPPAENGTFPPHKEAFFNLTVAVRAGAFPDVDVNAGVGTWVFHTNEALREAVELEPCPHLFGAENAFSSSKASQNRNNEDDEDGGNDPITARWSTTFIWNMTRPPPSVGGDFATTLFVAVYGDTVDNAEVSGEGEDRGVDGGDDAELLWALGVATRVSFSYCTEDTCPRDRGQCRTTSSSGDEYVKISKCYCYYGYGGEACAYRTISVVSRVWKFFCLVFSNLAVIPGVWVALSLGAAIGAAPAVVLLLTGIASAFYHMCDLDFTCAAGFLSYHSLQALDFFFSFFAIAVLVLHLCPMPWDEPLVVMPRATSTPTSTASGHSNDYQIAAEDGFNESSENPGPGRETHFGGVDSTGGGDETLVGDHEGRQPDDPEVRGSSSAMMHGGSLEEEKEEEEKERRGDKDGTRLAALYACLIPPLLLSVTDNPTAGVNLAVEFALCGAMLVFSWGRLVARDARGWRSEAAAKLDEEWVEEGQWERSGGIVPGGAGTEASISIGGGSAGEASRVNVNADETVGMLPNPWGPFMEEEEQEEVDEGQGKVEDQRGRGEERGNASVVRYRNSSPPASSRRQILRGRGREAAFGGDSNEGGSFVVGSGQGQSFGFWYSGGKSGVKSPCRDIFQSLRRVAVDRGLLDWRQLGLGVAGFTLGLACFILQGIPGNENSYHLWHSAWHILAMGSAVPILKARRWGREVETSVGAVACSGRGEMRGESGSRWSWKLMTCFRGCGAPVGSRTYEMVPDP